VDTPPDGGSFHGWSRQRKAATMGGMEILLNGQPRSVPAGCSVAGLLREAGHGERRVAVEINGEIVPRSAHAAHPLRDGDRVEIVQALGGG
jgi:sulfur carrier protein